MAAATNDLNKIIKSNAKQMNIFIDTIKEVVKNCQPIDKKSVGHVTEVLDAFKPTIIVINDILKLFVDNDKILKRINQFGVVLKTLNQIIIDVTRYQTFDLGVIFAGTANYMQVLQNIVKMVQGITALKMPNAIFFKIRLLFLKWSIKSVYKTIQSIMDSLNLTMDIVKNALKGALFKPIMGFFDEMKKLIDVLSMVNIKTILISRIRLRFLRKFIKKVVNTISDIYNDLSFKAIIKLALSTKLLQFILIEFNNLINILRQFLSFKTMFWLWWRGKSYIKKLKKIVKYINKIAAIIQTVNIDIKSNVLKIFVDIIKLNLILYGLQLLINAIRKMKIPFFFKWKVKSLIKAIHLLRKVIIEVAKFIRSIDKGMAGLKLKSAIKRLKNIKRVFKLIIDIVRTIVITALAIVIALPAFLVLLLGVMVLRMVINTTIRLIKSIKLVSAKTFFKLTVFILLLTLLVAVALAFVIFSLIAPIALKGLLWFSLFILSLILVVAALAVLGLVLTLATPLFPVLIIGLILICAVIVIMFAVVIFLKMLESINLNKEAILENVRTVISTAKEIISTIFDDDTTQEDEKGKPWYATVLEWFGGVGDIITAILAVVFLALIFVSIFLILIIATFLRLLQSLDLNPKLIEKNVQIVISTAYMVISAIFDPQDGENNESKKGFFETILDFLGVGVILQIIKAIMAIAFLALIMVAISLILFIAVNLRLLQNLDLNSDLIKQNVGIVISTAQLIVSTIFDNPDDKPEDPSKKGFFQTLLEFLGVDKLLKIITALMAIAFLALILVSVYLIKYIAETLVYIQDLQLDETKIQQNVSKVMSCSHLVINTVFQKDNTTPKKADGVFGKLLKMILPSSMLQFLEAIAAIGFLSVVKTSVGLVAEIARDLASIVNLPSMDGIENKVRIITRTAKSVAESVFGGGTIDEDLMEDMCEQAEYAEEFLENMLNVPKHLNAILTDLKKTVEFGTDMSSKASDIIKSTVSFLLDPLKGQTINQKNYQTLENVVKQVVKVMGQPKSAFDNSNELLKNYGEFLTKINNSDLTNLQTTVSLFEKMAELSESINGNFDKLAESLNEKIAPLLEDLKESLSSVSSSVAESNNRPTEMEAEKQGIYDKMKANGQTNNLSENEVKNRVDNQYNDKMQQRYGIDEVVSKLTALINLFRNGDARVRT